MQLLVFAFGNATFTVASPYKRKGRRELNSLRPLHYYSDL